MEASGIIALILWATLVLLTMIQYAPYCKELSKIDMLIVLLIFIVGAPIFALNNILTILLSLILPEGWDDEDDEGPKGY